MAKLSRKEKVKLARRLLTLGELRRGVSIWSSKAWMMRKMFILKRLDKKGVNKLPALNMATLLQGKGK